MELVIDANIFIAALVSPTGHTADLFFFDTLRLYTPEFLLEEVEEHSVEIIKKTGLSEQSFQKVFTFISSRIIFIPTAELVPFSLEAKKISPDCDDVAYIASAIKLLCPLWSNG